MTIYTLLAGNDKNNRRWNLVLDESSPRSAWHTYLKLVPEKWSRSMAPVSGACAMGTIILSVLLGGRNPYPSFEAGKWAWLQSTLGLHNPLTLTANQHPNRFRSSSFFSARTTTTTLVQRALGMTQQVVSLPSLQIFSVKIQHIQMTK